MTRGPEPPLAPAPVDVPPLGRSWRGSLLRVSLLVGLFALSARNFEFFHAVVELFCVGVAVAIVVYAWNARGIVNDAYGSVLGIGYGWMALLDLVHTLSFPGMSVFRGLSLNHAIQFWLIARVVQTVALLAAPLLVARRPRFLIVWLAFGALSSALFLAIVRYEALPLAYAGTDGTTPFKSMAELSLAAGLGAAWWFTWRARRHLEADTIRLMSWSIALTIASEVALSFYRTPYGLGPVVGHLLKVIAFYVAYRAILLRGSLRPFQVLFRDALEGHARFAAVFERMYRPAFVLAPEADGAFVVRRANPSAAAFLGRDLADLEGRRCSQLFEHDGTASELRSALTAAWNEEFTRSTGIVTRSADGVVETWIEPDLYRIPGDEIVLVLRDRTAEMQTVEALRHTSEELRRLHDAQHRKLEEERRRIAQELHDELGQVATAMTIGLDRVARRAAPLDPGLFETATKLKGLAASTVDTIRRICAELRPSQLDLLGLPEALEAKLREFERETGIEASLHTSLEAPELDLDLTTALYRIAQESLTNVARHSFAGTVKVTLSTDADAVRLEVEDDGRGITELEAEADTSLGVLGMRERALARGGRLDVVGVPDGGTRITAIVPRTPVNASP